MTAAVADPGRWRCDCILSLPLSPKAISAHLMEFRMSPTFERFNVLTF
jgi:hypothetical protein